MSHQIFPLLELTLLNVKQSGIAKVSIYADDTAKHFIAIDYHLQQKNSTMLISIFYRSDEKQLSIKEKKILVGFTLAHQGAENLIMPFLKVIENTTPG